VKTKKALPRISWLLVSLFWCAVSAQAATRLPNAPTSNVATLIRQAERVVFVIPFSHWDTDWHNDYAHYAQAADRNILAAIALAQQDARFRYTLEQPLFVQHFWDHYPQQRALLKTLVQNRQFSFAWAGLTQPESSLVAPAIQVRNVQLGQQWISATFGAAFIPHSAWQSDAFGNSAALPLFLQQRNSPYLFIGRWQGGCDPDHRDCTPFPQAFYWKTPASNQRVLVAYIAYPAVWGLLYRLKTEDERFAALRKAINRELARTAGKFIFLPVGFDFVDPFPDLLRLIDRWNASDPHVTLVMADPEMAFRALATQDLPEINQDLNPVWQAFYGSRPEAKIADKESEYFLSAADKFGLLSAAPQSSAWYTAAINAHYDNISGVAYDNIWVNSQHPRYRQTVTQAAQELATNLAQISSGVDAPMVVFNPTSWPRSEVVEVRSDGPPVADLPQPIQRINNDTIALWAAAVPSVGYRAVLTQTVALTHPVQVIEAGDQVTLRNGLVSVTVDGAHGAAFSSLKGADGSELLAGFGDDVVFFEDNGDVYGAFFGKVRARSSQTPAQLTTVASGPLLARVQAVLLLGGLPVTKTITLRANALTVEVALTIKALPQTSVILQIPTTLHTIRRTDDLGFTALTHAVDDRPIVPGDVTYRRKIFYPMMYWSDVTENGVGLSLLTHGIQGIGGASSLNLLLTRWAEDKKDGEGLTDPDYHTLRYAYLPHTGTITETQPWLAAYAFNQPLIPVWRQGERRFVQLPFVNQVYAFAPATPAQPAPRSASLFTSERGVLADVYWQGDQLQALSIDYSAAAPLTLRTILTLTTPHQVQALHVRPVTLR
jgi:hypothetical protein